MTGLGTPVVPVHATVREGTAPLPGAPSPPRRWRMLTWLGLLALVGSAIVGSNVYSVRDRLFGAAVPDPVTPKAGRIAGAAVPPHGVTTRLRSAPWWQEVTTLEGTGSSTSSPFTIDDGAIQWRAQWTCTSGRLVVRVAGQSAPLIDAPCTEGGTGFAGPTGTQRFDVMADGPWRLEVAQRIDTPLVEPPLPAMTASGTAVVARGSFHKVDQSGTGKVTIYSQADGRYSVRLDDFFVTASSQLQLRLTTAPAGARSAAYRDARSQLLTVLDVTAGSMNLTAPVGVDPTEFTSVVVWSPPVNSAYAAANLGPA